MKNRNFSIIKASFLDVSFMCVYVFCVVLTWTTYYLAAHPNIQERARQEALHVIGSAKEISADHIEQLV